MQFLKQLFSRANKRGVFIPFDKYDYLGGPSTFMRNLKNYLDAVEYEYCQGLEEAKGIFFPISYDIGQLTEIKNSNGKIVQRLDGIYYKEKHGPSYLELNNNIKNIYQNYANHVVFQSEYCRRQCFELFGVKEQAEYSIIKNGVNTDIFYPSDVELKKGQKVKYVSSGNFRNLDMLEPVILALDEITSFDFELILIGPVVNDELKPLLERSYVKYEGEQDLSGVSRLLREAHIFIYSHLNPPCPNSVLEASACGLPIVGFDSGSMNELLYYSLDLLAPVSEDIFQKYVDFDHMKLKDKLEYCVDSYQEQRQKAMTHCKENEFENCGSKYVEVFSTLFN